MPIKYIDIFLQFKVLYGKIIRSRWEMSLVVYNSLIEKWLKILAYMAITFH